MIRPRFSRVDLEHLARVLGLKTEGLSDSKLLDAVHAELGRRRDALEPAGKAPRRVELGAKAGVLL